MNLNARAASLKQDIPAVYLALRSKRPPVAAKLLAGRRAVDGQKAQEMVFRPSPLPGYGFSFCGSS